MAPTITAPVATFNGNVGGVQFANGTAETDNPAVIAYCEAAGYKVEADKPSGPFNPSKHGVEEVLAYLNGIDNAEEHDAEVIRVLEAEKAGKKRKGVIEAIEGTPDAGSKEATGDQTTPSGAGPANTPE